MKPCDKIAFSKTRANKFIKGKYVSRIKKKRSRVYLCDQCNQYHVTTSKKL